MHAQHAWLPLGRTHLPLAVLIWPPLTVAYKETEPLEVPWLTAPCCAFDVVVNSDSADTMVNHQATTMLSPRS